jgi:hypothetical protein
LKKNDTLTFARGQSMVDEKRISLIQRWFFFFLLFLFPIEPSHFKWHIKFLQPFADIKLSFFLTDLVIVCIFLLFFLRPNRKWLSSFWLWPSRWLWLFYGMAVVSVFCSSFPWGAEQNFRLLSLWTKILLFSSLVALVQESGRKFLHQIFCWIGVIAFLESVVALFFYYTQTHLDLKYLRIFSPTEMSSCCGFSFPQGFLWIGDRLLGIERSSDFIMRAYGTFNYPNILGGFLVFSLMISYFLFFQGKNKGVLVTTGISIFLQVLALSVTYCRSAYFSWLGGSFLFFFLLFYSPWREKLGFYRKKVRWLFRIVCFSLLASLALFGEQFFLRGMVQSTLSESDAGRIKAQNLASSLIKKHPVTGVGLGNFSKAASSLIGKNFSIMIHNIYLLIGAEMGLWALLFFLGFVLSPFYLIQKKYLSLEILMLLSCFVAFLTIGLCDFYPFTLQAGMIPFFILAALFTAVGKMQKEIAEENKRELLAQEVAPLL